MGFIDKIKTFGRALKSWGESTFHSSWNIIGEWKSYSFFRKSDEKLIKDGYVSNDHVFAVIHRVASVAASIPIKVQRLENGQYVDIPLDEKNMLRDLLNKPNPNRTGKAYRFEANLMYLLTGNTFEYKMIGSGMKDIFGVSELYVMPSQWMCVNTRKSGSFLSPIIGYTFEGGCYAKMTFAPEEIIHAFNLDPSYPESRKGLSFLQPTHRTINTSNQANQAEESLIENRGADVIISSGATDGTPLSAEDKETADNAFKDRRGGVKGYGSAVVLNSNVGVQKIGDNLKDMMLTEISVATLRKFCATIGAPSQLFNDTASSTYNNFREAKASLYTEASIPVAQAKVDEWNEELVPIFNELDNTTYFITLDTSAIEVLQSNKKEEAEKNAKNAQTIASICEKVYEGKIPPEQGINILIKSYKMTEEEAKKLIPSAPKNINNGEG